eukprot:3867782-Amphidinium_carterae.1
MSWMIYRHRLWYGTQIRVNLGAAECCFWEWCSRKGTPAQLPSVSLWPPVASSILQGPSKDVAASRLQIRRSLRHNILRTGAH